MNRAGFPVPCRLSSLRSAAGLEDVLDESCGGDAEDELVPECDDSPGTTGGTKFPLCIKYSSLAWLGVPLDRWPTNRYVRVLRRAFQVMGPQACLRVIAP